MKDNPHYLILGKGRCARHFARYFELLQIPFQTWSRAQSPALLETLAAQATHVLLLVSDKAIEEVAARVAELAPQALRIHFSGALVSEKAFGAHPLMTFGEAPYSLEVYREIPFVLEGEAPAFETLLPLLPNRHARISKEKKAYYHALCVLAGNFSCLLWQRFFGGLKDDLGIDPRLGQAYLKQQTDSLLRDYSSALTGPLTRGDKTTIQKNLEALEDDAFADVYRAFVAAYQKRKEKTA